MDGATTWLEQDSCTTRSVFFRSYAGLIDSGMPLLLYWKQANDIAADAYVLTILHHYVEFAQNLARLLVQKW